MWVQHGVTQLNVTRIAANISQTALALALIVKVMGRSMSCVLLLFGRIHSTSCLVRMQTDLEAQVLEQTSVMLFCLNSVIR